MSSLNPKIFEKKNIKIDTQCSQFLLCSRFLFFVRIFGCRRRTLCKYKSTAPYECNAVAGVITTMRVPQDCTIRAWLGSFICNVSSSLRIAERCPSSLQLQLHMYNIIYICEENGAVLFCLLLRGLISLQLCRPVPYPNHSRLKTREEFSFRRPWRQSSLLVSDDCAPLPRFNSSKWDLSQCFQGIYENKWRIIDGELERGVEHDNSTRRCLQRKTMVAQLRLLLH